MSLYTSTIITPWTCNIIFYCYLHFVKTSLSVHVYLENEKVKKLFWWTCKKRTRLYITRSNVEE